MLTTNDVYEVLKQALPEQNDFFVTDYVEELQELLHFGITTNHQLLDIVSKHREEALAADREPLDEFHIQTYCKEYGKGYVEERVEKQFWFAYPGLLRIILELEFGDSYRAYSDKRDNV